MIVANSWEPSRAAALERLNEFGVYAGDHYAKRRNFDEVTQSDEPKNGVSRLSPWLRHRALLESEVLDAVLNLHGAKGAQKFIQEVFWRSYWKGWLQHRPALWDQYQLRVARAQRTLNESATKRAAFDRAVTAETDIEVFNSWVRELLATGYLHNHARMWFASIWIFTLRLPWELGADFFLRHLLDGDPASNTLSWRWVAGLHTNGKNYLATQENIRSFAPERATLYPKGLDLLVPGAEPLQEDNDWPTQPEPLSFPPPSSTRHKQEAETVGFLLHEDDCGYGLRETATNTAALAPQKRSDLPTADLAIRFSSDLLRNVLAGQYGSAGRPGTWLQSTEDVVQWAVSSGLSIIYTPLAPVGPTAKTLTKLSKALLAHNIELLQVTRHYDELVWPHASKGFFRLNKKIPDLLDTLTQKSASPQIR